MIKYIYTEYSFIYSELIAVIQVIIPNRANARLLEFNRANARLSFNYSELIERMWDYATLSNINFP